ncbi:response regulator transcription factor [Aquabacterium sp. OR-4]|uniref:response regulator transcription factor n=1 Tax=Aquabacterium sp. OR-4 TaxID=2978127 RepID=UPI0021B43361|nr:response regulator transcription factor [Aquabacterium sp. OR-4]MDT7836673.1 response regulator transcription factor [Aquabacterium sp. OR-4]
MTTLPQTLALIDDDAAYSEYLSQFLQSQGIAVRWFADSDDLLCSERPFEFDFYIVDLMLPGVDGLSLLRLLRRRTEAGVLVVSGKLGNDVFDQVIGAGADMHLAKPVTFEQVLLAVGSVYRRAARSADTTPSQAWRLDEVQRRLVAPDGAMIELSPTDVSVLACLLEAKGETVGHQALLTLLGLSAEDDPNRLHATIYRLRRRIERATPALVPLQSKSRVGYMFRAPLVRA